VGDWLLNLPIPLMAIVIFAAVYLITAAIYLIVTGLAVDDRARAFKAFSPGMLPPLGIIFGLLVGFVAVQVWNDFDKAKAAIASEASLTDRSSRPVSPSYRGEDGSCGPHRRQAPAPCQRCRRRRRGLI
jgi:hypothetical protein